MIPPAEIAELWRHHAAGLGLFVRVRCDDDAADLIQEAFIRLAKQRHTPDDPLAWLARTVRNLAVDRARSESRRRRREELFVQQFDRREDQPREKSPSDWTAEELAHALASLDDFQRDVIIAHLWNGMTFRQIAAAFSVSLSSAHRGYSAGIEQLKKQLGGVAFEVVRREIR